ncbi:hypothetical protein SALLE_v1c10330 [Spiroplasma alleghenense]|uniref:Uncharacterized protein n=1 Tax=Spiroplasma alleghenense TaxID=216931 RepID=A0A345Z524_9MOLU|nr:hypothetical protein SALLE_v1c10330 [Spiroplasma alleghenense]
MWQAVFASLNKMQPNGVGNFLANLSIFIEE